MALRSVRAVRGVRSVSTFQRGQHDPFNAITQRLTPRAAQAGPMAGWNVSVKENIAMADVPLTCSSRMLLEYRSPFDATVVEALNAAGANITARTNCDEFAMGALNAHSVHGPVANPAVYSNVSSPDLDSVAPRAPGGSSGGAAASVAGGLCRVAIGTDTGGSVRLPGAFCGVYGFKPSYGMISRWGVVSYADSLDTVGILANNVSDVRTTLHAVAAEDPRDETCIDAPLRARLAEAYRARRAMFGDAHAPLAGLRVGVPAEMYPEEVHPRVVGIADDVLDAMQSLGAEIVPVRVPAMEHAIGAYYVLGLAEASSNLSRYDGMRYGIAVPDEATFHATIAKARSAGFGPEVQRRILLGTYAVTTEAWDSYYMAAVSLRCALMDQLAEHWRETDLRIGTAGHAQGVDVLVHPTALRGAPKLAEDAAFECAQDALTTYANLAGVPVLMGTR
ncbi:hypothetical protein GLX27_002817 [Malassezia furfur]|uniref:Amidase domain-containing protein n=1 Tax=Malassezia furfur TaxID=55194 RepID=A0ABY8ERL5_MALFU|nr:hypothetical protein GLX27_002817 [Malassezia furfur]